MVLNIIKQGKSSNNHSGYAINRSTFLHYTVLYCTALHLPKIYVNTQLPATVLT